MDFEKALGALKDGRSMRRECWDAGEGYLKILPGMKHVWKIMIEPQPNAGNFIFLVEDFTAQDWVDYKAPVEAEKSCSLENEEQAA